MSLQSVGGDIVEVIIDKRIFSNNSGATAKMTLPGTENKLEMNGNGSSRLIKKRIAGGIKGLNLGCSLSRGDLEFLTKRRNLASDYNSSITFEDGSVYSGKAVITGNLEHNNDNSTAEVDLEFTGPMKNQ